MMSSWRVLSALHTALRPSPQGTQGLGTWAQDQPCLANCNVPICQGRADTGAGPDRSIKLIRPSRGWGLLRPQSYQRHTAVLLLGCTCSAGELSCTRRKEPRASCPAAIRVPVVVSLGLCHVCMVLEHSPETKAVAAHRSLRARGPRRDRAVGSDTCQRGFLDPPSMCPEGPVFSWSTWSPVLPIAPASALRWTHNARVTTVQIICHRSSAGPPSIANLLLTQGHRTWGCSQHPPGRALHTRPPSQPYSRPGSALGLWPTHSRSQVGGFLPPASTPHGAGGVGSHGRAPGPASLPS